MENKDDKIIKKINEDNEDDWESIPENEKNEETKDVLYRLNFEKASKVKLDFTKLKNYHSIKVKKLGQKEIESFFELDKYIKEEYIPNINITHILNSNPYVTILNNDYLLKKHPEVGTYLIYEMDDNNQEAKLIGKSDTWYEATIFKPKMRIRKPVMNHSKNQNAPKISKSMNLNKKVKNEKKNNNDNTGNLNLLNKKRKRKKKKRIYLKDSTVIEIKRIFDNKEKEEDKDNKLKDEKNINLSEEKDNNK